MSLAVVAALGSAAGFAVSTSLQHRVATSAPPAVNRDSQLLGYLLRRPSWLLGLAAGGVAFALHAMAVRDGALALVQPLMVSGMVFAVAVRSALDRHAPSRHEVAAAATVAFGLGLFVVESNPSPATGATHSSTAWLFGLAGVALVATCSRVAKMRMANRARGLLLGGAAGILFGLVAGTLKMSMLAGVDGAPNLWLVAALVPLGCWGLLLNQRSYQVAPLSVSMPILNMVNVLVAIGFGFFVFGEIPAHQPGQLAAEAVGLTLMAVGIRRLAKSPAVTDVISDVGAQPVKAPALAAVGVSS